MTSCTNSLAHSNAGQVIETTVSNIPRYYRPKPQNQEISFAALHENECSHAIELSVGECCDDDLSSMKSYTDHPSLDGESLNTCDWIDLVGTRDIVPGHVESMNCSPPMTIEVGNMIPCIQDVSESPTSSDDFTVWSEDEADETSVTTEMECSFTGTTTDWSSPISESDFALS